MNAEQSVTQRYMAGALKALYVVVGGSLLLGSNAMASTNAPVVCPNGVMVAELPAKWRAIGDESLSNSQSSRPALALSSEADTRIRRVTQRPLENPADAAGTVSYWKAHPEAWPVSEVTIGKARYVKEMAIQQILAGAGNDASLQLGQTLLAAKLNFRSQSTVPVPTIAEDIERADELLQRHPPGCGASGTSRSEILDLALTLDAYNRAQARDGRRSESPELPGIELNASLASATAQGASR